MEWVNNINTIMVLLLLVFISIQDIRFRIISNRNILLLSVLLCLCVSLQGELPNLFLSAAVLLAGFILFQFNVLGAGDVKLVAALALALNLSSFFNFLFLTTVFGGVIAIVGLVFFNRKIRQHGVPYGVAISLSFVFFFNNT